ncbi:MAG: translation initiation factor IF-3 [Proteobacteria bacterium]|nr:translation initiation factor IF-3 [Pseudomonadota bacterium]
MTEVSKNKFPKANREIRAEQVRLIDSKGQMVGVVPLAKALQMANDAGLDLVEISPNAEPPVCKILDFSRFKYDAKKKIQEAKKKQKKVALKEMKFKVNIGQGDLDVKIRKIKEFLEDGDKVKLSLWFKGREIVHKDKGKELFDRILESLGALAKIEFEPKMEGKQIIMIISANSNTE